MHCSQNYLPFFVFLTSAVITAILAIAFSIVHLVDVDRGNATPLSTWEEIGSLVILVLAAGVGCPVLGLLGYHLR